MSDSQDMGSVGIANIGNVINPTINVGVSTPLSGERIDPHQKRTLRDLVKSIAKTSNEERQVWLRLNSYCGVKTYADIPVEKYQLAHDYLINRQRDARAAQSNAQQTSAAMPTATATTTINITSTPATQAESSALTLNQAKELLDDGEVMISDLRDGMDEIYDQLEAYRKWIKFGVVIVLAALAAFIFVAILAIYSRDASGAKVSPLNTNVCWHDGKAFSIGLQFDDGINKYLCAPPAQAGGVAAWVKQVSVPPAKIAKKPIRKRDLTSENDGEQGSF